METKLKVTLLTYTPNPDTVVATAAKLCYSPSGIDGLMETLTPEKTQAFVQMLASFGHESPTEHVSFTFAIEGVSRSLLAQITRHRLASYSVKSQRYVAEGQFDFVLPPEIEDIPEAKAIFLETMEIEQVAYNQLTKILMEKHIKDFIHDGKDEATAKSMAEKKAIEDARYVLPNACETKMIVTMNTRSLMNFFHHRCCERAQWEIRDLAVEMLKAVKAVAPTLFLKAGPSCLTGSCPEGKMSCGKMAQKKQFFGGLS